MIYTIILSTIYTSIFSSLLSDSLSHLAFTISPSFLLIMFYDFYMPISSLYQIQHKNNAEIDYVIVKFTDRNTPITEYQLSSMKALHNTNS